MIVFRFPLSAFRFPFSAFRFPFTLLPLGDVGTRHAESAYALLSDTACRVPTMLLLSLTHHPPILVNMSGKFMKNQACPGVCFREPSRCFSLRQP